jgi:hypothetical protein
MISLGKKLRLYALKKQFHGNPSVVLLQEYFEVKTGFKPNYHQVHAMVYALTGRTYIWRPRSGKTTFLGAMSDIIGDRMSYLDSDSLDA